MLGTVRSAHSDPLVMAGPPSKEALVLVSINGVAMPNAIIIVVGPDRQLLLPVDALTTWHIALPGNVKALMHERREYVAVRDVRGLDASFDEATQQLDLRASPSLLPLTRLTGQALAQPPTPSPPGAYLNYDLAWQRDQTTHLGAQLELGVFSGPAVLSSSWLGSDLERDRRAIRLDSAFTVDLPTTHLSLKIGDGISAAGDTQHAVRFGGLQFGTDFSTTPEVVTFPLPSLRGAAAVPSTVDLYVNNVLAMRSDVPAGPFTLNRVPIATGAGQIQLSVQDALGREQIVTQSYYISPALLRDGLSSWSVQVGALRNGYGLASNDYGPMLLSTVGSLGLTDGITGSLGVQAAGDVRNLSGGALVLMPTMGVVSVGIVGSRRGNLQGASLSSGIEHAGLSLNLGVDARYASSGFRAIGMLSDTQTPAWEVTGHAGWNNGCCGSFGVFTVIRKERSGPNVEAVSLSADRSFRDIGAVSVLVTHDFAARGVSSVYLTFTHSFGDRTSSSLGSITEGNRSSLRATLQRNLPRGNGFGYQLLAEPGSDSRYEATAAWQGSAGAGSLGVAEDGSQRAYRANASGAIAVLGGESMLARRIDHGFAIVQVPGLSGQPIYQDQQLIGHTDARGLALLNDLRPFESNHISLDAASLPLSAAVGDLDLNAVPYRHGGLLLRFAVDERSRLVHLRQADGRYVPAGAVAVVDTTSYPVASEGAVFISGAAGRHELRARWSTQQCIASVDLGESADAGATEATCR